MKRTACDVIFIKQRVTCNSLLDILAHESLVKFGSYCVINEFSLLK